MINIYEHSDTIIAPATPTIVSAIAILRLSGKDSISIVNSIFKGSDLTCAPSHTVHYGYIIDDEKNIVDEVLVTIFKAPKSFTTEDVVEISCHGSPFIVNQIMECALAKGARIAQAGEFTIRAFINGRINLAQAEAVSDLIASETKLQHQIALNQLRGGFSNDIAKAREELVDLASLIELELDFAEEDVEFADKKALENLIIKIKGIVEPLSLSFLAGNAIKDGVPIAIAGKPNAGKSTLLNVLLNEQRAIVSAIEGTTRDTIEEVITLGDIKVRLIDTAGLRETKDEIEQIGVLKSIEKIEKATLLLYLIDIGKANKDEILDVVKQYQRNDLNILFLFTKCDTQTRLENEFIKWLEEQKYAYLLISSKLNLHIDKLKIKISETIGIPRDTAQLITNQRHYNALLLATQTADKLLDMLQAGYSQELIAFELKTMLDALGSITGKVVSDEILATIFSRFCIGK